MVIIQRSSASSLSKKLTPDGSLMLSAWSISLMLYLSSSTAISSKKPLLSKLALVELSMREEGCLPM